MHQINMEINAHGVLGINIVHDGIQEVINHTQISKNQTSKDESNPLDQTNHISSTNNFFSYSPNKY